VTSPREPQGRPEDGRRATVADVGEHALIARIKARLTPPAWVVVGPGDDAAVIEPEPRTLDVVTTDSQVEGIHFDRRFCPPDAIGHKALAVNLSDLAAMGALPRASLLSLVLPGELAAADVDALLDGLLALAAAHRVALIGGNITRAPQGGPLVVDVTAIGSVSRRRVLQRNGAKPGDEVYVTGSLGAGVAGLRALQAAFPGNSLSPLPLDGSALALAGAAVARYLRPEPRVRAGLLLGRNRAATACMDLSDGLADGVRQIADASHVGMVIDAAELPIHPEAARWFAQQRADPQIEAAAGGDDYELVFTVRPAHRGRLRAVRSRLGDLSVTKIGVVTKGRELVLKTAAGERELPAGFEHFRQ
jgi:thiamine-monophosphate kinase